MVDFSHEDVRVLLGQAACSCDGLRALNVSVPRTTANNGTCLSLAGSRITIITLTIA